MYIVQVHVTVEEDAVQLFKTATVENAKNSIKEPGIAKFDVLQQKDDPSRFVLIEVYQDEEAAMAHKRTEHYLEWRSVVEDLMAEPRYSIKYTNVFPKDSDNW